MKHLICMSIAMLLTSFTLASEKSTFNNYHAGHFDKAHEPLFTYAKQGNKEAQYYLANMYMHGYGVKKDFSRGIKLMTQSGLSGYMPALLALGKYYFYNQHDVKEALPWFKRAADQNNLNAQLFVILAYAYGYGTKANIDKVRKLIIDVARKNNAMAQYELARVFFRSKKSKSIMLGKLWLRKSARKGYKPAIALIKNPDGPEQVRQTLKNGPVQKNKQTQYIQMKNALIEASANLKYSTPMTIEDGKKITTPKLFTLTKPMIIQPNYSLLKPSAIPIKAISTMMLRENYLSQTPSLIFPIVPFTLPQRTENYSQAIEQLKQQVQFGDPVVQYKLAQMYEKGLGTKKDLGNAFRYYLAAAKQNYLLAQYEVGILYLQGKAVKTNTVVALAWLTKAALRGNAAAQFVLGTIYEFGINQPGEPGYIKRNVYQAKALYNVSALHNNLEAKYRLAQLYASGMLNPNHDYAIEKKDQLNAYRLYKYLVEHGVKQASLGLAYLEAAYGKNPKKLQDIFKHVEIMAVEGNTSAQLLVAILYDRGIGVQENKSEAIDILQTLAKKDNAIAQFMLGTYQYINTSDKEKAIYWLDKSAKQNNPYALYNLAILAEKNEYNPVGENFISLLKKSANFHYSRASLLLADHYLVKNDNAHGVKEAVDIYKKLAAKQNSTAQLKLGYMHAQGIYFKKNEKMAFMYYKNSAKNDNHIAQYLLARQYQTGTGTPRNIKKAIYYFTKSAKANFVPAQIALGYCLDLYKHQYKNALDYFLSAAKSNNAVALFNTAVMYEYGKGTKINADDAFSWYEKSAEQGYPYAQYKVGLLYLKGNGVGQDSSAARQWFEKAANKNNIAALYQLGLMYETGVGCELNLETAQQYYTRAAKLGNVQAQLALARLNQNKKQVAKQFYQEAAAHHVPFAQYRLDLLTTGTTDKNLHKQQSKYCIDTIKTNENPSFFSKLGKLFTSEPNRIYMEALDNLNNGMIIKGTNILQHILLKQPEYHEAKTTLEYYLCTKPLHKKP